MELVLPICEALKCFGHLTCTYMEHHRKLERRLNDLLAKQRQLNAIKSDVEMKIKIELRLGRCVRQEVENWLLDVQTINGKIQSIDERTQNLSCFSRGHLGKQVSQTVEEVKEIIEQGRFTGALVIDDPSTAGVPFQLEHLEGETAVIADIWKHLMSDEIGMVGVCGMGGIGKTTIMKHIHNKLLEETRTKPLFEKIIWFTVSQDFNITRLQQDIADAMNIEDLPKPEQKRAAVLRNELRQIRHVLILDDVWEGFVLEKVGIPIPIFSNGSRLVLTSRSKVVCRSISCCEIIEVSPLSNEESMNLFLAHTGRGILKVPSLEEILGDIIEECDGLPLAIAVIAGSMKGIYDVVDWRNALTELGDHITSVKGTDKEIYGPLKFSFDRLEDSNIQNCFLYCSLYPEDCRIPRVELIEYWIDEGFLERGSRQQLHDRGHTILNRLVNNYLLEMAGDDVKMHDLMRDMALYIKHPYFMVKAGTGLKDLPSKQEWKDVKRVSFMMNMVSEIPPSLSPNCQNLSTLLLQNNESLKRISESFFQHMHSLSVLNLSYTSIEQLPNSVSNLETLNALVLRGCKELRYVPSLEKLKALRKLDLQGTGIEKVPKGLEMLANLTYLNLCTESLNALPIAILPRLSCLQCLVLYVKSPSVKINGLEATRLRKLEVFEGRFNELIDFNAYIKSIQGRELTSYLLVMASPKAKFDARPLEQEPPFLPRKRVVILSGCPIGREDPVELPSDVKCLRIFECPDIRSLSDMPFFQQTNKLGFCSIHHCRGIESLLDLSSTSQPCNSFQNLELLWLENLDNLHMLVKVAEEASVVSTSSSLPMPGIFSNLESFVIKGCPNMKQLFPCKLAHDLQNLKKLVVCHCVQMEEIISSEEEEERHKGKGINTRTRFSLPKLQELVLAYLAELKSICSSNRAVVCDSLWDIEVRECMKLKRMPLYLPHFRDTNQSVPSEDISISPREWWESVEWDYPKAKEVLRPWLYFV
ncbi:hypothetical protein ES332_A01G053200v1 [Gossypium tomentosum]|uniref:Uncharacterized protein n=1 Tax=Gossypium tomentosum TaxID=34277 RepID=A0A5D2RMY5_GOSTO|nr:hypothetical protein ES332_A01G053200v1 [Gossypium tomentosum]